MNMTLSALHCDLMDKIKQSWASNKELQGLIQSLSSGEVYVKCHRLQGLLYRKVN